MLKNFYLLLLMLATLQFASAQTVILDFESDATSTTFQYFGSSLDGSLTSVVANPNPTGINTSDNVTEYVKAADAQTWAGAFSNPNPATPVDVTASTQVCIKVHFSQPGNLALKLENSTTGGANWTNTEDVTTTNEWTEICFDVTQPSEEDPFTPASGHVYSTVTLFFDFGTAGTGEDVSYYFDDLVVPAASVDCTTVLDFEEDASSTTFQYFGSTLDGTLTAVVANPNPSGINTSDNVTEYVKPEDAQTWAGAFSNPNPATPVDVSDGGEVCIKVHFDHVGNLSLKLENSTTGGSNWARIQDVTTINEWTEICFDVSEPSIEEPFTPASGHVYSTITLFFDFGIAGSESAATSYFDDIVVCGSGGTASVDVDFAVDMNEYTGDFTQVYVSGTFNDWSGDANPLDDSDGDGVWEGTLSLSTGLYEYKFTLDNWTAQEEFMGTEDCTVTDPSGQFVNRQLVVSSEGTDLPVYCWNSCYACGEAVMITFNLGASNIDVDTSGLYIAGGGNFGNPGDFPLRDDDGDEIWSITFEKPIGFSSYYTFTNGACPDYSCKEDIAGLDCANPDNFNDRFLEPVMEDTAVSTCFGTCDAECTTAAGDLTVDHDLFTLTPTVASNTVWVDFRRNSSEDLVLRLTDATGQVLRTVRIDPLTQRHALDVARLPAGVYLVNAQTGRTLATRRFVKQ